MEKFKTVSFSELEDFDDGKHMVLVAIHLDGYERERSPQTLIDEINSWIKENPSFFMAGKKEQVVSIKRILNHGYSGITNALVEFKYSMMKPLARLKMAEDWKWIEDFVANSPLNEEND